MRKRNAQSFEFTPKSFQAVIRTLTNVVTPIVASMSGVALHVLHWQSPLLTLTAMAVLLLVAALDIVHFAIPLLLFANAFGIVVYGALSDQRRVRASSIPIPPHRCCVFACLLVGLVSIAYFIAGIHPPQHVSASERIPEPVHC
jgi:hypothetical protein